MTHLVTRGRGTEQIEATSPEEALQIARQYLGEGDWRYVAALPDEVKTPAPHYDSEVYRMQTGRDPLDEGE